jgi:hypothetical protein
MPNTKPARRGRRAQPAVRGKLRVVPNAVAVHYCAGHEKQVRQALAVCGDVEVYPAQRMVVVERPDGSGDAIDRTLGELKAAKAIDFVTPVLVDQESGTRQVLTDEIVLRLKPGRTRRTLQTLGAAHGVTISRRNEFDPAQYVLKVAKPSGTDTLEIARSLDASEDVEFASPNFLTEIKRR